LVCTKLLVKHAKRGGMLVLDAFEVRTHAGFAQPPGA